MTTQLLRDLRALAALFEAEGAWRAGLVIAWDRDGNQCLPCASEARRWSVVAALRRVTKNEGLTARAIKMKVALGFIGHGLAAWEAAPNRTQADVKRLIARAIERVGGEG